MLNKFNQPEIVIIGGDNPNTLGIIRTLGEQELDFKAIIVRDTFVIASKSKYLKNKEVYITDTIEKAYHRLLRFKADIKNDKIFLLVEGDKNTGYLDKHYNEISDKFVWNSAGEHRRLSKYLNKEAQIELVKRSGINVLPTVVVDTGTIPEDLQYPVITKAITSEISNWKSEVYICNNDTELKCAFQKIKSPRIMLQKYVHKINELCLDGYSIDRGRKQFISIASTYNYLLNSGYSYYCTVTNFNDIELLQKITNAMTEVGYEGIYCIEFIIDENNIPYFLEINFRNSGWSYVSTCLGMPLPTLWIESMMKNEVNNDAIKKIPEGYKFMSDFSDFRTRAGKMVSYHQWLREYIECGCRLEMGKKDIYPFLSYIFHRLCTKLKKCRITFYNEVEI